MWKERLLSMVGRLCLIKSVLTSLLIYFMSVFKIPKGVGKLLSSIQRRFLWCRCIKHRSFYKIQWRLVICDKKTRRPRCRLPYIKKQSPATKMDLETLFPRYRFMENNYLFDVQSSLWEWDPDFLQPTLQDLEGYYVHCSHRHSPCLHESLQIHSGEWQFNILLAKQLDWWLPSQNSLPQAISFVFL